MEEAYSSTLKPWHGWISSAAYKVSPEYLLCISGDYNQTSENSLIRDIVNSMLFIFAIMVAEQIVQLPGLILLTDLIC